MKREEQITSEAKKHYYDDINCYNAFLHGVEWADRNPVNVWHDASVEPKGTYIVMCDGLDNSQWVVYWLYIDSDIPIGKITQKLLTLAVGHT